MLGTINEAIRDVTTDTGIDDKQRDFDLGELEKVATDLEKLNAQRTVLTIEGDVALELLMDFLDEFEEGFDWRDKANHLIGYRNLNLGFDDSLSVFDEWVENASKLYEMFHTPQLRNFRSGRCLK